MVSFQIGRRTIEGLAFAPDGTLYAAARRALYRLDGPAGRVTHTTLHLRRCERPVFGDRLAVGADGLAVAGRERHPDRVSAWRPAAGGRLERVGPAFELPDGVPVGGADPVLVVVTKPDLGRRPVRFELAAAGGRVLARLPLRLYPQAVWQKDERTLLAWEARGLVRLRLGDPPRSVWRRLVGGPAAPGWRAAGEFAVPPGVRAVARHPDARTMLVGTGSEVAAWDFTAGREVRRWRLPVRQVQSLAVAPDGLTAAAGGWTGGLTVFDLE